MVTKEIKASQSQIEAAIEKAVVFLPKNFVPRHEHSKRCYNILKHILYKDEYTVIEAKQSSKKSIAPIRLVATNQRIIRVKPSFWSIWTGRNIFTPTKYESIPYSNLANITFYTGMFFSTLHLHLTTMSGGEESIEDLKTQDAKAMFIFLEKTTEYLRRQQDNPIEAKSTQPSNRLPASYVDLGELQQLVKGGSKIVWLGVEPAAYVADLLDIHDKDVIMKMNVEELTRAALQKPAQFDKCILICYSDNFSARTARFLKQAWSINMHVLSGGIEQYEHKAKGPYPIRSEVSEAQAWL